MDFEKICRLCLQERGRMRSVSEYQSDYFKLIFDSILQIEVTPDDELPQKICWQCISTLNKVNNAVQEFRTNNLKLHNQLSQMAPVKTEIIEDDEDLDPVSFIKCETIEMDPEETTQLDEDSEATLDADEKEDVHSPAYDVHEGLSNDQTNYEPSELVEVDLTAGPAQKIIPEIIIPKGKPGRPRVRPIIVRRKGVFGRRPQNPTVPKVPRQNEKRCYICMSDKVYESAEALFFHLNSHADLLPYTCTICVRETVVIKLVTTLNIHKRMHLLPIACEHCDKRFVSYKSIELHIMMQHQELTAANATPMPCPTCGKKFLTERALKFHMHSHNQKGNCEICGKMYYSKSKLRVHIQRVHENAERVECNICHKKLKGFDALKNHMQIMHSDNKMQCKYCSKTYTCKGSLLHHEKRHETIPEGKEISRDWKEYYTYVDDENTSSGARRKKCNLCGIVVLGISAHLTQVHFPKKFNCDQCEMQFRDKRALAVHKLEHDVGKILKCPICDREFTEARYLMMHLKTKKHRDHPLAQNTDWLDAMTSATLSIARKSKGKAATKRQKAEEQTAVENLEMFEQEWSDSI
uniref:Putative c2h2-type zn-finger protein n=1 Tax=Culex tarsalis TaxID=7177 RepID=A0A1Q3EZL6_CULTA